MNPPLTAVTVCFNESRHLRACLESVRFCDETVMVDLGSTDASMRIATALGARIVPHPWVPVVEMVRAFTVAQARTDWVVFVDPDQIFPAAAVADVRRMIAEDPQLGLVSLPMVNHFKGRPVRYGRWGARDVFHPVVMHRERVAFSDAVHRGIAVQPGFSWRRVGPRPDACIVHHWSHSWRHLLAKANRYLEQEGPVRFAAGHTMTPARQVIHTARAFADSLITRQGYRDGRMGIGLSLLAAYYEWRADGALARHARSVRCAGRASPG